MAGRQTQAPQPGMIGYANGGANPAGGFKDPATGTQGEFPTVGVEPSQMYDTASRSALSKQNFDQSQQAQESLFNRFSSMNGANGAGPVQYGGPDPAALQRAQEAEFARGKDKAGLIAKSAMTGLHDSMAGRGMLGSGMEGEEAAKVVNSGATQLGDLNRQQVKDAVGGNVHAADMQFQGDLAQRAQQQSALQGLMSLMASTGRAY